MLEHFSTNESSVLCCPKSRRPEALEIAKKSDNNMKDNLEELDDKIVLFNAFVSCLHNIVSNLPRQPLGKNQIVLPKKIFREIAFLAILNFFPVQKLIFGHF